MMEKLHKCAQVVWFLSRLHGAENKMYRLDNTSTLVCYQ